MVRLLLPFALCVVACGPPESVVEDVAPDPVAGASTYQQHCLRCHQENGTGQPATGPALAADFNASGGPLSRTDEELMRTIRLGRMGEIGAMPPWRGVLSTKQQRDVVAYLRQEFEPSSSVLTD
ncbi:MAG TPA: hypothetical protein DDW23_07075 [Planctomycetes bacterium]|nr:hypothetical protein [Planctomycetota bacterium]